MENENVNILGKNLIKIRKHKGYARDDIPKLTGISKFTYKSWEIGRYEPNVKNLIIISRAFNVSIDELVGNVKSENFDFLETYNL